MKHERSRSKESTKRVKKKKESEGDDRYSRRSTSYRTHYYSICSRVCVCVWERDDGENNGTMKARTLLLLQLIARAREKEWDATDGFLIYFHLVVVVVIVVSFFGLRKRRRRRRLLFASLIFLVPKYKIMGNAAAAAAASSLSLSVFVCVCVYTQWVG